MSPANNANGSAAASSRAAASTSATVARTRTANPAPHRRTRERPPAAIPRRVSGPAGGRAGAPASRATSPAPARRAPSVRLRRRADAPTRSARALAFVRGMPEHAWLDRLVRGRAWIPVLGVLLAGIVAMQVEVLKLGAGIGRSIERTSALSSENELLRAQVSGLADDQRIERVAASYGMIMPGAGQVGFLSTSPANAAAAAGNLHAPDATAFEGSGSAFGAIVPALPALTATTPAAGATPSSPAATPAAGATTSASASTPAAGVTTPASAATPAAGATTPASLAAAPPSANGG